jgi:hypothetical protein
MTDQDAGTEQQGTEAQSEQTGTPASQDEVTTLKSRNAGLDAKVSALLAEKKALEKQAADAAAKLAAYEAGKVGADEALRAQIAAKDAELETTKRDALLARIEAKYPETFAVLGDAAANLSAEKLAEAEARFKGVSSDPTPPTPRPIGNNPSRTSSAAKTEESFDDIAARLKTMEVPW